MRSVQYVTAFALLGEMIGLGSCTQPPLASPVLPATPSSATPSPRTPPTDVSATTTAPPPAATTSPTPAVPPASPPPGLVYRGTSGNTLWIAQAQGPSRLIFEAPERTYPWPSNDFAKVDYVVFPSDQPPGGNPVSQHLVDIKTGSSHQIWPVEGRNLCLFSFLQGRSDLMDSVLMEPEADQGYDCRGSPVIAPIVGSSLGGIQVLDAPSSMGGSDVSPNTTVIAFDNAGSPYLYYVGDMTLSFVPSYYGLTPLRNQALFSPSWSPSGRFLAWDVTGNLDGRQTEGVAIFDLELGTSSFSPNHPVSRWEIRTGVISWSADEQYLSIWHDENHYLSIIDRTGATLRTFDDVMTIVWSTLGHQYALSENSAYPSPIELQEPGNPMSTTIGTGSSVLWSPDGTQVLFRGDQAYWLYDLPSATLTPLALESGARVLRWVRPD